MTGEDISAPMLPEQQPLLAKHAAPFSSTPRRSTRNVVLILITVATLDFCMVVINISLTRVYEAIVCYHHLLQLNPTSKIRSPYAIPEQQCKLKSIQQEVALLRGVEAFLGALPCMCSLF